MMSPLEQVLAAAKSITDAGKQPSLALIKTKLGNSVPMPILIQGLQQFKSMSQDAIEQLQALTADVSLSPKSEELSELDTLKLELKRLKEDYQQLNSRLTALESGYRSEK
ncbi:conserved hypothetical protein [Shewanella woodyi ATCC 51908]|uniref:KfrA N-terminal DNA-binding domain-containing protein n=2 Tax=Shewanella woodyi TaxID=60961 RepID=B1KNV9_SHEWM|nr:conserved hypothetical protein [Shewanella woodyi ATCC 51908]